MLKFPRLLVALALLAGLFSVVPAQAQGCGPSNPNCIVPTAPPGTNDNRAASTAFVQNAVGGGGGGVTSFNSRTGAVLPQSGDYSFGQIAGSVSSAQLPAPFSNGTASGNTSKFATTTGALTSGNCVSFDASGNLVASGAPCAGNSTPYTTPAANGAVCDVIQVVSASVSITSGTAALTVTGASFVTGDVGKIISIPGAGTTTGGVAGSLNTTIAARISATQVTLAANAANTLTAIAKTVTYGTNDTTAFATMLASSTTYEIDLSKVSTSAGCMINDALTITTPKHLYGNGWGAKLFFRQTASGAGKNFLTIGAAAGGTILSRFGGDFDLGGQVSSAGITITVNTAATNVTIDNIELDGNKATQAFPSRAIDNLSDGSKLINSYVHGYLGYAISGAFKASHVLIDNNRVVDGPKNSVASGVITFLSSGQTGSMSDLRITNNSIDMSNVAAADQSVAIYVYGGSPSVRTNMYNNIVVANNTLLGTANSTTTLSAGILVTQAYSVSITGNSVKWFGEGIGTGSNVNLSIVGNSLYGNGTYSIESNGDTGVVISGNSAQSDGYSAFGITVENMINGVISGNTVDGTASAATYNGITVIGVSNSTGNSTFKNVISGNTVILPSSGTGTAIRIQCNTGATLCSSFAISGNMLDTASAIGASSTGVWINRQGATSVQNFQIGPNYSHLDVGVLIDAGVTGICYLTSRNNSNTAITNNGAASSCS